MMNYQQIECLTYERQATFLAEAEQRRLTGQVVTCQAHPVRVWLGQRLIAWGQRWSSGQAAPTLTAQPVAR